MVCAFQLDLNQNPSVIIHIPAEDISAKRTHVLFMGFKFKVQIQNRSKNVVVFAAVGSLTYFIDD